MRGVDFAWQVHAVQEQWSARADTKATVVFTVEAAVIAAVVAAFGNAAVAASMTGWRIVLVWLGVLASAVAIGAAAFVVAPQLGSKRKLAQERHVIYFGHLRSWEPQELAQRLEKLTDSAGLSELSVQLTRTAAGNWRKYVLLRVAVILALSSWRCPARCCSASRSPCPGDGTAVTSTAEHSAAARRKTLA
jgi:hypothetical protein